MTKRSTIRNRTQRDLETEQGARRGGAGEPSRDESTRVDTGWRIRRRWYEPLLAGLRWRGADGGGFSLGTWLLGLGFSWLLALLFMPLEPALLLVPPMLALALLVPCVQALARAPEGEAGARWRAWQSRLEMPLVMLVLAAVGFGAFGPMWRRGMLIDSGDHQFMMGRAQIFYDGLRHGHWQHWTHLWQGGDTITDLYPIEANLLTALVHALLPRGTPFVASYTLFVLWAWWLRGVGVYYLARRFSAPAIAFVLAYASLFDVGKDINGGVWFGALFFGMIHNALALSFGLFATALQVDLTRKLSGGRLVACALAVALAACGHALGMLAMVVSTVALGVALGLGQGPRRGAWWALVASGLGLTLSAVWLLPFSHGLAVSNFRVATGGATYSELGRGILDGSSPTSSFAGFLGLAFLAAIVACFASEIPVVSAGIASLLLVALALSQLLVGSRFYDYAPAFLDSQPLRMLTVFKTAVVPCVAWLLQAIYRMIPASSRSLRFGRVMRRTALCGLLLYGLGRSAAGAAQHLQDDLQAQIPHVDRDTERSHTGSDYRRIFDWLKEQRQQDRRSTPWRVAVLWKTASRHAAWTEGMNTGVPVVDPSQVPSNFFAIRPREISARGFNDWNVRYATTDDGKAPFKGCTKRFSAGRFQIWEVDDFDDRYVVAPADVRITELELDGESIRFRVAGAPPGGVELQLRTAGYVRWRARQAGAWLAVGARLPRPDSKPKQQQLLVHAGNGLVVLTCDGTLPRFWLGLWLTLLALVALPFAASEKHRQRFEGCVDELWRWLRSLPSAASRRFSARQQRAALGVALAALIGTGVMVTVRGGRSLAAPSIEGLGALTVRWTASDGQSGRCWPLPWLGRYTCDSDAVVVDNWLGTTGPGDDSGEFAALWPGIRVAIHRGARSVTLHYGRIRLDAPRGLWLQTSEWGGHHLKVSWGDRVIAELDVNGEQLHQFDIPENLAGTRPLQVEVGGPDDSSLVLRGGAGLAPQFR